MITEDVWVTQMSRIEEANERPFKKNTLRAWKREIDRFHYTDRDMSLATDRICYYGTAFPRLSDLKNALDENSYMRAKKGFEGITLERIAEIQNTNRPFALACIRLIQDTLNHRITQRDHRERFVEILFKHNVDNVGAAEIVKKYMEQTHAENNALASVCNIFMWGKYEKTNKQNDSIPSQKKIF